MRSRSWSQWLKQALSVRRTIQRTYYDIQMSTKNQRRSFHSSFIAKLAHPLGRFCSDAMHSLNSYRIEAAPALLSFSLVLAALYSMIHEPRRTSLHFEIQAVSGWMQDRLLACMPAQPAISQQLRQHQRFVIMARSSV